MNKVIILLIVIFAAPVSAGWVDLQSNDVFTEAQLTRRYDRQIRSKYPLQIERALNRRAMGAMKGKYTPTAADQVTEAAYETHCKAVRDDLDQAIADNVLLASAIQYEQAERRLARYQLSVGVAAVAEVPELVDVDTGEIILEYVPAVAGIDPLPVTVERVTQDEEGAITGTETIPNPAIVQDEVERAAAKNIVDGAGAEVLALVEVRK